MGIDCDRCCHRSEIATVYSVIAEPQLDGVTHVIVKLEFVFTDVTDATGMLGLAAASTLISDETVPKPNKFSAFTLQV